MHSRSICGRRDVLGSHQLAINGWVDDEALVKPARFAVTFATIDLPFQALITWTRVVVRPDTRAPFTYQATV